MNAIAEFHGQYIMSLTYLIVSVNLVCKSHLMIMKTTVVRGSLDKVDDAFSSAGVTMTTVPESDRSVFLGVGTLVGGLVAAHLVVLFFWFWQLAKGTPPSTETKKQQ